MTTTTEQRTRTMQAIVQDCYGQPDGALRLAEVPRPEPDAHEVLVRVRASSVNTPDWVTVLGEPWFVRLAGGLRRPRTPIRGTDVAGVVERVGAGVTDIAPGDEVFGSPWTSGIGTRGAFCEYTVVPASMLAPKPAGLSWVDAAVSVMSGLTSLIAIRDVAEVGPGMSVLINGASGGLGTFMVQLAEAFGAEVTGVCSSRNVELVRSLGATHVVDYSRTDLADLDRRYDIVIDNVLSHPGSVMTRLVTPEGLLVPNSIGQGGRLAAGLPRIAWTTIRGAVTSRRVSTISYDVDRRALTEIADLLVAGEIRAVIDSTHDLSDVPRAVARMASHRARGNIAISVP